jgi:hypothetical protein
MVGQITLEELYNQPLVGELIHENKELKSQLNLSKKPKVDNLNNISLPYTVKNHLLIDSGIHNGIDYLAQILRLAVSQHENLPLFLEHDRETEEGGTTQTWVGEIRNPKWSDERNGIVGDIDIVDPKTAMAVAYGAKWGVSATVAVDEQPGIDGGAKIATDPEFKSYALVLTPAVRGTMLNQEDEFKKEEEEKKMVEEMNLKEDLKPAQEALDDAVKRATASRDNDILVSLRQVKAILTKLSGSTYPYPGKGKTMDADIENRFDGLEQAILQLTPVKEETDTKSEELKLLESENKKMKEELVKIRTEELAEYSGAVLDKEKELGLVTADDESTRRQELEAMAMKELKAIEQNLDKTMQILAETEKKEKEAEDGTPKTQETLALKKKEKGSEEDYDRKLLDTMIKAQGTDRMELGGY